MINLKSPTLKFSISGLRGLFPQDINSHNIPEMIWAFHQSIGPGPVVLARDNRPTGAAIEAQVSGILTALGRDIYTLGVVPTPTIKAFVKTKKLPGAIMISASHNPVEYTAFKFIKKDGFFFSAVENDKWQKALKTKNKDWGSIKKQGSITEAQNEAIDLHIDAILKSTGKFKVPAKIKVAIDPLGACAAEISQRLLKKLGVRYVAIHDEVVPYFPRGPEPVASALKKLGKLVRDKKCDIGFAFDPDSDRLALVGPDGKALGEELTLPLALSMALVERPSPVVVNLSSSWLNQWITERYGHTFYRSAVGEANVVDLMLKKKAALGGEGNGGVIDTRVPSLGRDAICGMAWLLKLLSKSKRTLPQLLEPFPKTVMFKDKLPVASPAALKKLYSRVAANLKGYTKDTRDGLHLSAPEGLPWLHIRPSNTEPIVRIIAEGKSHAAVKELLKRAGLS